MYVTHFKSLKLVLHQSEIRKLLKLEVDFVVKKDKMGRPGDELNLNRSTSRICTSLGLKSGDVLHIKPLDGVRFNVEDADMAAATPSTTTIQRQADHSTGGFLALFK